MRVDADRSAGFDDVGNALERDPATRVTAHREAMQAVVDVLLHIRGIQHRDQAGFEDVFALVRKRGGLGRMIVAGEDQNAAVLCGAGRVAMLEHVAATVHAGALAVPHRKYAVVFRALKQVDLLRSPDRGRRQILVYARLELDVMLLEEFLRLVQRQIEPAQRRAAVTRDESRGVEPRGQVTLALHHWKAHKRLRAGQENTS